MTDGKSVPGPDPAQARVGDLLRGALTPADEVELEDETRRLMLHLSLEPTLLAPPPPATVPAKAKRTPLLGRLTRRFRKRGP